MKERELVKVCKEWLTYQQNLGVLEFIRVSTTGVPYGDNSNRRFLPNRSMAGFSDFMVLLGGHVLFIELKSDTGRQSEAQRHFEKRISEHGGHYRICRTLDEFIEFIELFRRRKSGPSQN